MHQGLFRTWGKTWKAGDLLGESTILFRTLSLLNNICYYVDLQMSNLVSPSHHITTCSSSMQLHPSTASSIHAFIPTTKPSMAHFNPYQCGIPSSTKQMAPYRFSFLMHTLDMVGILRPVGCRRVQCPCGGGAILSCLSLLCPTYMNDKRNSEESNKVKCWMDVISERVLWAWQTL